MDAAGEREAGRLKEAGVPPDLILVCPPDVKIGRGDLEALLLRAAERVPAGPEAGSEEGFLDLGLPLSERSGRRPAGPAEAAEAEAVPPPVPGAARERDGFPDKFLEEGPEGAFPGLSFRVAVLGGAGGAGRTSLAASLAAHFRESGEAAAVLDLGSPPAAGRHLRGSGVPVAAPGGGARGLGLAEVAALAGSLEGSRWVFVDFPAEFPEEWWEALAPHAAVVVTGPCFEDAVQAAELVRRRGVPWFAVYMRAVPEAPPEACSALLGRLDAVVPEAPLDALSARAAGEPLAARNAAAAEAVGRLAAALDGLRRKVFGGRKGAA
jgi:hypothetical protein